jgi:hypothetical protein
MERLCSIRSGVEILRAAENGSLCIPTAATPGNVGMDWASGMGESVGLKLGFVSLKYWALLGLFALWRAQLIELHFTEKA